MATSKKQVYITSYDDDAKVFNTKATAEADIKDMIGDDCSTDRIKVYKATEVSFTEVNEIKIS